MNRTTTTIRGARATGPAGGRSIRRAPVLGVILVALVALVPSARAALNGTLAVVIGPTAIGDPTGLDMICTVTDPDGIERVTVFTPANVVEQDHAGLGCPLMFTFRIGVSHITGPGAHGHNVRWYDCKRPYFNVEVWHIDNTGTPFRGPLSATAGNGAVNTACGEIEDVLFLNGDGGGVTRELNLAVQDPLVFSLIEPSSRAGDTLPSRACIYLWTGEPHENDLVLVPRGLGIMGFGPYVIATRAPFRIFNGIGFPGKLGAHTGPGAPPVVPDGGTLEFLSIPGGIDHPVTVYLQGLIEDSCSQATVALSVTNGFTVKIQ